jgi:hypothetical protein
MEICPTWHPTRKFPETAGIFYRAMTVRCLVNYGDKVETVPAGQVHQFLDPLQTLGRRITSWPGSKTEVRTFAFHSPQAGTTEAAVIAKRCQMHLRKGKRVLFENFMGGAIQ